MPSHPTAPENRGSSQDLDLALESVYDRLRGLAAWSRRRRGADCEIQTTVLANEAVARLLDRRPEIQSRRHLLAVASMIMRQILVDHFRARQRLKSGVEWTRVPLDDVVDAYQAQIGSISEVVEVLDRLRAANEQMADLVEFRFYLGLSMAEAADAIGIPKRTAERRWKTAQAWLRKELADDA